MTDESALGGSRALGLGAVLHDRANKRRRYRKIASALARHGLSALATRLHLGWPGFVRAGNGTRPSGAEQVRLTIEELGTTAIKLGQILGTRPDLIPEDLSAELEKLRDRVPPAPAEAVVRAIESELGRPLADVFDEFDETPLASASIGQVHSARLKDGTPVVVKVRKPGIAEEVSADLAILSDLARRAARARLFEQTYDLEGLAADFAWTLRAELDYRREGRNADRLREILRDEPSVLVPRVYWQYTSGGVIVMQRLMGEPIVGFLRGSDDEGLKRRLAETSARALMRQVFEAGFFHADPHPGNFLVLEDGRIGLVDFGMVGQLSDETRDALFRLLSAVIARDAESVADTLDDLGIVRTASDREGVRRDAEHLIESYFGLSVDEFKLSDYISDVLGVVRRHHLQLPTDLALVLKTVAMSEGLWRQLDPKFNAVAVAAPYVRGALTKTYSPRSLTQRALRVATDSLTLGSDLPGQLRRVARRLDRGDFELALRHRDLEETVERLSEMVTRLSTAIIAGAFILGLPTLATVWKPPGWDYVAPVWFTLGAVAAVALLLRLALGRRGGGWP